MIPELEKAVAAREQLVQLARKRFEAGILQPHEMSAAEAELAEARVQLLDRRGAASARGGDTLVPLTRELQNLGIDIRDRKARLAHVAKKLQPLRDVAQGFDDLEWMQEEARMLRRSTEAAQGRVLEAEHQLQSAPEDRVVVTTARDYGAATQEAQPAEVKRQDRAADPAPDSDDRKPQ